MSDEWFAVSNLRDDIEAKYLSPANEVSRYWDSLYTQQSGLPYRTAFNPRHLTGKTLKQMVMLSCKNPHAIDIRLTGTGIDDLFGDAFGPLGPFQSRTAVTSSTLDRFFVNMRSGRYMGVIRRSVGRHSGTDVTTYTHLMPLLGDTGEVDFLVGTIEIDIAAWEALGLNMRISHSSLVMNHPRSIHLYDVRRRNRLREDLTQGMAPDQGCGERPLDKAVGDRVKSPGI